MGDLGFSIWRITRGYRDPVSGTLRVTARDWHRSNVTYIGVVSAPGLTPTPVSHKTSEPSGRYVVEGIDLPVIVDRAEPAKLKILWKQVPTEKQYRANLAAEQMRQAAETAARMAAGDANAGATPGSFLGANPFVDNGSDLTQAVTAAIAEAFGGQPGTVWGESHVHVQINNGAPITEGIPATATVLAAQEVTLPGALGNLMPAGIVDLTLEVAPPDGDGYTTHTRLVFSTPERRARIAAPGTRLPIRIDPNRRMHVEVDRTALDLD